MLNAKVQEPSMLKTGRRIFMVEPSAFDVVEAINPHMRAADGSLNQIDKMRAKKQWEALCDAYVSIGMEVDVLDGAAGLPDMVFCANQSFPYLDSEGRPQALLSNMASDLRQKEVAAMARQFAERGITVHANVDRSAETLFEGMGDALWVPGGKMICGGYGPRTRAQAYDRLEAIVGVKVERFELPNPKFYHLDTCLSILDEDCAIAARDGFTAEGWAHLKTLFPRLIEAPLSEADAPGFACNAHCPDQKHVLIQRGCPETCAELEARGFTVIELDTDEFIKSGGSVFCMKLQAPWN